MALGIANNDVILTGRQAFYNKNNFTDDRVVGQIFFFKSAMVYIFYILRNCRLRVLIGFVSQDLPYQSRPRPGVDPFH